MKTFFYAAVIGCTVLWREVSQAGLPEDVVKTPNGKVLAGDLHGQRVAPKTEANVGPAKPASANILGVKQTFSIAPNEALSTTRPSVVKLETVPSANASARKPALQPAGPLLTDVHNRGPAPAAIGGPSNFKNTSIGVINGTTVNRK